VQRGTREAREGVRLRRRYAHLWQLACLALLVGCGADPDGASDPRLGSDLADAGPDRGGDLNIPDLGFDAITLDTATDPGTDPDASRDPDAPPEVTEEPSDGALIAGQILFLDRPFDESGYLDEVNTPVIGVALELVSVTDGRVLRRAQTDSEGRFEFSVLGGALTPVRLEAVSEIADGRFDIAVINRRGRDPYVWATDRFALPNPGDTLTLEPIVIDDPAVAAAFNIAETARRGLDFLAERVTPWPDDLPEVVVLWQAGIESPCGTCYTGFLIDLTDADDDPDGYDDDIILHELGHYVQRHMSADDSPGGSHDGTPTDPRLAYGEGFATFFSLWVRGSELYQDDRVDFFKNRWHELLPEEWRGTSDGRIDGDVSEVLTAALMWDLLDDSPDEGGGIDRLSGDSLLVQVLFEDMNPWEADNIGFPGIDVADFINLARCRTDDLPALRDLVELVEFPFDFDGAPTCD